MRHLPAAVLFLALISVAIGCRRSHDEESFYSVVADAKKDGSIARGWIPDDFLPGSSREIHEVHDLSPSTEWCAFAFAPTDSQKLLTNLKVVDQLPLSLSQVPDPETSWWPSVLVGKVDIEKIHKAGLELYTVERPATAVTPEIWLFAIDWSKGRGFFIADDCALVPGLARRTNP